MVWVLLRCLSELFWSVCFHFVFLVCKNRISGKPVGTKENDVALLEEENEIKYTESLLGLTTATVMQSCFVAKDYKRPG
jgi:hypothetical protein